MLLKLLAETLLASATIFAIEFLSNGARFAKPLADSKTGARRYSYAWPIRALAIICLPITLLIGHLFQEDVKANRPVLFFGTIFLCFAAVNLYLLLESFLARIIVSDQSIISVSPLGRKRELKWEEVDTATYLATWKCYKLTVVEGKKIYASDYLAGVEYLSGELRRRIPKEKWLAPDKGLLSIS